MTTSPDRVYFVAFGTPVSLGREETAAFVFAPFGSVSGEPPKDSLRERRRRNEIQRGGVSERVSFLGQFVVKVERRISRIT